MAFQSLRVFIDEARREFHTVGAILPSSRALGRALARPLRPPGRRAWRVLEVGPGTGAVTDSIVEAMGPADRLDIVEVIPAFVQHLRARIEAEGRFSNARDRVRVFRDSVEGFSSEQPYDLIVSSLPLNNFTAAEVELILATFARLAPGGLVSFFEYLAIRRLRGLVSGPAGRTRLRGVGAALGGVIEAAEVDCARVWTNIPPAVVHVLDVSLWPRAVETPKIEAES